MGLGLFRVLRLLGFRRGFSWLCDIGFRHSVDSPSREIFLAPRWPSLAHLLMKPLGKLRMTWPRSTYANLYIYIYIYTLQCSFGVGPVYGQALMIAAKGTKGDSRGEDETHASKFKVQEYWFRFSGNRSMLRLLRVNKIYKCIW